MKKKWSDYLWIVSLLYLFLGLFHILFAWLGLICFLVPLLRAVGKGEKSDCNHYCGRGQLMQRLGQKAAIRFHHTFMDCADSMVCKVRCTGLDTAVCIRLLQSDADKHDAGHPHHAGV